MSDLRHPTAATAAGPPPPGYNYDTLSPMVFVEDLQLTLAGGPAPGDLAPDFELVSTAGERVRLSNLRGRPVLMIFGSVT